VPREVHGDDGLRRPRLRRRTCPVTRRRDRRAAPRLRRTVQCRIACLERGPARGVRVPQPADRGCGQGKRRAGAGHAREPRRRPGLAQHRFIPHDCPQPSRRRSQDLLAGPSPGRPGTRVPRGRRRPGSDRRGQRPTVRRCRGLFPARRRTPLRVSGTGLRALPAGRPQQNRGTGLRHR
jgi:hypothetical protein